MPRSIVNARKGASNRGALLVWAGIGLALTGCAGPVEFGPFVDAKKESGKKREVDVRPLFAYERDEQRGRTVTSFLWPLGHYRDDPQQSTFRFTPFYLRQAWNPDVRDDVRNNALLLGFWGHTEKEGSYAALFPIGGTFKRLFFKDRIDFALWPLWARVQEGGSVSNNFIWPIFNTTSGPVHGWKVWPLYGKYEKTNEDGKLLYDRGFCVWPFWTRDRSYTDGKETASVLFSFPFYGRKEAPRETEVSVLWPFFKYHEERGAKPLKEWKAPFPFVHVGSGKDFYQRDFWPVYGYRKSAQLTRQFLIWPIGRYEKSRREGETDRKLWVLPFYWSSKTESEDPARERSYRKIWPLAGWEDDPKEGKSFECLSPLWFHDKYGLEKMLAPFWRLAWWHEAPDGSKERHLLFGIWRWRMNVYKETEWNVLGGLVGSHRLLYFKFR